MAVDPLAVRAALNGVTDITQEMKSVVKGMTDKIGGKRPPHADTVTDLKTDLAALRPIWEAKRDALNTELNV